MKMYTTPEIPSVKYRDDRPSFSVHSNNGDYNGKIYFRDRGQEYNFWQDNAFIALDSEKLRQIADMVDKANAALKMGLL